MADMEFIWGQCKITGKRFSSNRGFLNHLRSLKMTSKEYYDTFHKQETEDECKTCGKKTKYHSYSYSKYCSTQCHKNDPEFRMLISTRFVTNPDTLLSFREKTKDKGDCNVAKRKETIAKKCSELGISETEYYSNHSRKSYTNRTPESIAASIDKAMETKEKTKNFGGKSSYKKYEFFDETVALQGYEPVVLDYLVNDLLLGKNQISIGKSKIPVIKYIDVDGKTRNYYPDFFLPEKNLLIEVKSNFTYNQHLNNVRNKLNGAVSAGYSIVLVIVSKTEARKCRLEGSKKLLDWAISSQASNPRVYEEGSTTIQNGVETSVSKCNPTSNG